MKFKRITILATVAAVLAAQTVGLVSTPSGFCSYSAGSAISKTLGDAGVRAIVQAHATTGFEEVLGGGAQCNVLNSFDRKFFATGSGHDSDQHPALDLRKGAC